MYSVDLSPDLKQVQVRKTILGVFLARIDIPFWYMVELMRRDFNEHHMGKIPMTENQLGEMQMMEEVAEYVGTIYPKILTLDDSTISFSLRRGIRGQPNYHRI